MSDKNKVRCTECSWKGREKDLLRVINPFDAEEIIQGCPDCKGADSCKRVCDAIDCWELATCGTPTSDGYRITCSRHKPE